MPTTENASTPWWKRLVPKVTPATPPRTAAPTTQYTRDVIAHGAPAVRAHRVLSSYDSSQGNQRLDYMQQTGYANDPTAEYTKFLANRGFNQDYTPTFGQTTGKKAGAYAGFKTEGELKAALAGRAETLRAQDRAAAGQSADTANTALDTLLSTYDTGNLATAHAEKQIGRRTAWNVPLQRPDIPAGHAGAGDMQGPPSPVDQKLLDSQGAWDANQGQADMLGQHRNDLRAWLADQSTKPNEMLATSQQITATPLRDYAGIAGREYGVDPNLIAGWFPEASQIADFTNQRNLNSMADTGMPYSDYQTYVRGLATDNRQAISDQRTAASDQRTAAADQVTADNAQYATAFADATGGLDVKQVAATANLTVPDAVQMVSDPNFQAASADVQGIIDNGDPETGKTWDEMTGDERATALQPVLDPVKASPAAYALMQALYSAYF